MAESTTETGAVNSASRAQERRKHQTEEVRGKRLVADCERLEQGVTELSTALEKGQWKLTGTGWIIQDEQETVLWRDRPDLS